MTPRETLLAAAEKLENGADIDPVAKAMVRLFRATADLGAVYLNAVMHRLSMDTSGSRMAVIELADQILKEKS